MGSSSVLFLRARRAIGSGLAVALIAASFVALTPSAASAAATESEPNSSTSTADALTLGAAITGATQGSYSDDDYFAVDVSSAGRTTFDLRFPSGLGTSSAYGVNVYNSEGKVVYSFDLTGANADGSWLRSQSTFLGKGRWYVRIRGYESWATWGKTYTLNVSHTVKNAETEFNDSTATADVIKLGATYSGSSLGSYSDDDYFAVDTTSAGSASLLLKYPSGLGADDRAYNVTVYNAAGVVTASYELDGAHSSGSWLVKQRISLPKGRSYIRIVGYDSWGTWGQTYTINVAKFLTTTKPKISGTVSSGQTIKAVSGTWGPSPVTLKYQWYRNGSAISGATGSSYKLTSADKGKSITVKVTGSKSGYRTAAVTSSSVKVPK